MKGSTLLFALTYGGYLFCNVKLICLLRMFCACARVFGLEMVVADGLLSDLEHPVRLLEWLLAAFIPDLCGRGKWRKGISWQQK